MTSRIQDFTPALAPELLLDFNFFELYPFDGGGSFINRAILGSVDDAEITDAIMNRGALDPFGPLEELDFLRFDRWSTIEQSCWINRMYFIVPLARQAARTRNRALAEYVRRVILRFGTIYPPPQGKEAVRELNRSVMEARDRDYNTAGIGFDGPICYQWFDFQPASRVIHILHAVWFLRDMGVFDDADYAMLDRMLSEHARVIFEANDVGAKPKRGNHEALRALALLACGILFQGEPQAEHWLGEGLRYCEAHILSEFLEDGMVIDLSPSYHFFVTWICRDAAIYANRCGHPFSETAQLRLNRAFAICRLFRLPNGLTPVVSDGYPLDMSVFCRTLPSAPCESTEQFVTLDDAGFAIRRSPTSYALLDCSPLLGRFAHYHAGKQAVTLWFGGCPFVEEGGCCNYDDPAFSEFFKTAQAHASLLVEGQGDGQLEGRYCWLNAATCRMGKWLDSMVESIETSPLWGNLTWTRGLIAKEDCAEIRDELRQADAREWTLLFPLAPEVSIEGEGSKLLLKNENVAVSVTSSLPIRIQQGRCVRNFRIVPAKCLALSGKGDGCVTTVFTREA